MEQNNKELQSFFHLLLIENTRVLYDFMLELYNRFLVNSDDLSNDVYKGYTGEESLLGRYNKINESEDKIKELISSCYENGKLLSQNPFSSYLKFYNDIFETSTGESGNDVEKEIKNITEMLNYFYILFFLTEPKFETIRDKRLDDFPYIFEDMCLSIKEFTNAQSCYLVYQKKGEPSQLISRSGYDLNDVENMTPFMDDEETKFSSLLIGSAGFDLLIKTFEKGNIEKYKLEIDQKLSLKEMIKLIYVKDIDDLKNDQFLMINFDFQNDENRHFYIILKLESKKEYERQELMHMAIRILFLRNRLNEAVEKYYTNILNFRFYCNYIKSLQSKDENVKILHITDLHLNDDDSWEKDRKKWQALEKKLTECKKKNKIDLLAVTGDIIDHFEDAASGQRKYKVAANLLFRIAKVLWAHNNMLPHDWKRRILITTGNHDYATMNDTRIYTEARRVATGLPGNRLGGTMTKYAYYIEFLSYFLDAPTQRLLKNDLNEVRNYEKLGIIVGIFNSCSQANSLQTNKVSFNLEKLELILKNSDWEESNGTHFVLTHHDLLYNMDYFDDKYSPWKWRKYFKTKMYEDFITTLDYFLKKRKSGKKLDSDPKLKQFVTQFKKESISINKLLNEDTRKEIFNSELYNDMKYFCNIIDIQPPHYDEYTYQFISNAKNLFETMKVDKDNFEKGCDVILNIYGKDCFNLCGHEHELKYVVQHIYKEGNEKNVYIFKGDKFYKFDHNVVSKETNEKNKENKENEKKYYISFEIVSKNEIKPENVAFYLNGEDKK